MTSTNFELIAKASKSYKIRDIVLYEAQFKRGDDPPEGHELVVQHKRSTNFVQARDSAASTFDDLLQVRVSLGVRLAFDVETNAIVVLEIEADFVVDFLCVEEISQDAVEAFSKFNAVHLVWPFWRQHVFDVVARARLPEIEIPMIVGMPK